MRLESVEQARFGVLNIAQPLRFDPGLNVVLGCNQAGKSSLLTLIEWLLYGPPPKGSKRNQQLVEQWTPWDGSAPSAEALLAVNRQGWPARLRVQARFTDFSLQLTDTATLGSADSLVAFHGNGGWNLGESLTGLERTTLLASLFAHQGQLENLLDDAQARRLLTADLAELVEDPDRAGLDSARQALEKPTFTCGELSVGAVQMPKLLREADRAVEEAEARLSDLQRQYDELHDLLRRRDTSELKLAELQNDSRLLETRLRDCDLAVARYTLRLAETTRTRIAAWTERIADQPWLAEFPTALLEDGAAWQSDHKARLALRDRAQQLLDSSRSELGRLQARLQRLTQSEDAGPAASSNPDLGALRDARGTIAAAQADSDKAAVWVARHGEAADPATREQFEQIELRLRPFRAELPALLSFTSRQAELSVKQGKVGAARNELRERHRAAAAAPQLWLGSALAILSVLATVVGWFFLPPAVSILVGIALVSLGGWLASTGLKHRKQAEKLSTELESANSQVASLDLDAARLEGEITLLRQQLNCSEAAWTELHADLARYQTLLPLLNEYASAQREQISAQERAGGAWETVRRNCPDAPLEPSFDWLERRISELVELAELREQELARSGDVSSAEFELAQRNKEVEQHHERLARLLEPVGLAGKAGEPDEALRELRARQADSQSYQRELKSMHEIAERVRALAVGPDQFDAQWNAISERHRSALEASIADEAGCAQVAEQRRKIETELARRKEIAERAREDVYGLQIGSAKLDEVPRQLELARQVASDARDQRETVLRWNRALELLRSELSCLATELGGNLAPVINEHLAEVLAAAPVAGVAEAKVNSALELNLRVAGAPPGLSRDELLERLSTGARRQLALALRIAVAEAMGAAHSVPLVLDEPLVELDDARALECLRYLERLAESRQVILTTCHETHHRWLLERSAVRAHVIELT